MAKYDNNCLRTVLDLASALADQNRLRALCALRSRELCVCQITRLLGLAPSTVSRHMAILQQANLVESRKEGRWIYYRLPRTRGGPVRAALAWALGALAEADEIQDDLRSLRSILRRDPQDLCRELARRWKRKRGSCAPRVSGRAPRGMPR